MAFIVALLMAVNDCLVCQGTSLRHTRGDCIGSNVTSSIFPSLLLESLILQLDA